MKQHIVLIGLSGTGKTTIGSELANQLQMPVIDVDTAIELDTGLSISKIFKLHGESYFRDLEADMLLKTIQKLPHIIATGGGLIIREGNQQLLKDHMIIYLKRDIHLIAEGDLANRPLLDGQAGDTITILQAMEAERASIYENLASLIVDNRDINQTVQQIMEYIDENNSDTGA